MIEAQQKVVNADIIEYMNNEAELEKAQENETGNDKKKKKGKKT